MITRDEIIANSNKHKALLDKQKQEQSIITNASYSNAVRHFKDIMESIERFSIHRGYTVFRTFSDFIEISNPEDCFTPYEKLLFDMINNVVGFTATMELQYPDKRVFNEILSDGSYSDFPVMVELGEPHYFLQVSVE